MQGITLSRHILEQEEKHPELRGELSRVLAQVGFATKVLTRELRRADPKPEYWPRGRLKNEPNHKEGRMPRKKPDGVSYSALLGAKLMT